MLSSQIRTFRRLLLIALTGLLIGTSLTAESPATPKPLENLDFEQGKPGEAPPGWSISQKLLEIGYSVTTVDEDPEEGDHCALLTHRGDLEDPRAFGSFARSVDATPYRGKRVRLSAAVRLVAPNPHRAQLWLQVERENDALGFFENMADRPITSDSWRRYEIIGDVAEDATQISLGLMLFRRGKAWIDSVSLDIVGEAGEGIEPPRQLTERELDNLTAFARLFGYVRYFHPSDQAAEADWNEVALAGVQTVEDAQTSEELAHRLQAFFRPIAPSLRVTTTGAVRSPIEPPANAEKLGVVVWHHAGLEINPQNVYRSRRVNSLKERPEGIEDLKTLPKPTAPLFAELGGGVSAVVPLALWTNEAGTLPQSQAAMLKPDKPEYFQPTGDDRATRLANVILAWNVLQHFYPYFDVVPIDWPSRLDSSLKSAATDIDSLAFQETLQRLIATLQDGHGGVRLKAFQPSALPPFLWRLIGNDLVITKVAEGERDLRPGDVVVSVNGEPTSRIVDRESLLISSATPQYKRYALARNLIRGQPGDVLSLEVRSPDSAPDETVPSHTVRKVTVERSTEWVRLREDRPEKITELEEGIFYLDISRLNDEDFKQALDRLNQARGIIFDLRGYPGQISPIIIAHLIDEPVNSARWQIPIITRPDRVDMEFSESSWPVEPQQPRLDAPVAFLTDGRAISYAETYLGIIEHYRLAEIVGEATAGTNGNINPFTLPGGYLINWTGMKVLKHDGSRHHGVGIQPTIPVTATIQGIAAGHDEVLERALEVVRSKGES